MNSAGQWTRIAGTAAGTATIHDRQCVLERIVIPASTTGTVTFYDHPSAGSNTIFAVVNDTVDFPTTIECNIQCKNGLTYIVGGTTGMTVVTR